MNGGLGQFFSNSTGVLAPEAAEAFTIIGMPKCADALFNAMKFFGETYPRDRAVREEYFSKFNEQFDEEKIPLKEYEGIMATEIEDENGCFELAADNYANQG